MNNQYKNNENCRTACKVRSRVYSALKMKDVTKANHTFELVDCTINELIDWFEFTKPYFVMETYDGTLHIDHIRPLSLFNLNNSDELKEACHWSNLRYLTAEENLQKSNNPPTPLDKFKIIILKYLFIKNFDP